MLLSAYRKDDYADPEGFIAQLGAILERYAPEVVSWVTSPHTGIQRTVKFPPTIAEIVEACDLESERQERMARYQSLPTAFLPRPRQIRAPGSDFESMFANHGRPIGVFENRNDTWNRSVKVPVVSSDPDDFVSVGKAARQVEVTAPAKGLSYKSLIA